jgi:hypothetical protein
LEEVTEERSVPIAGTEPPVRLLEHKLNLDAARIVQQVERDLLAHLRGLSPPQFEELCALYLRALGCEDVRVVGAATAGSLGDQGIDVIGTLARPGLPAVRLAVQAKRVTGGVGPSVVAQLRGSVPPGTYGVIITTGHFTRAAIVEADRADRNRIKLVDGSELAQVLVDSGIGVKSTAILVPRLDIIGLNNRLEAEQSWLHSSAVYVYAARAFRAANVLICRERTGPRDSFERIESGGVESSMSSRSFLWKRGRRGSAFQARTDGALPYTAASSELLVQAVEPGVEYVRYLYESTRKWCVTAEAKAQLLLTVNGSFVTIIFGTLFGKNSELHADAARFSIVTWSLLSTSVVALTGAIACAGLCLWSMHGKASKELEHLKVDPNNPDTYKAEDLWYFGHLARLRAPAAVNAIRKADRSFEIDPWATMS